jgi:flagellar protein FliO/FliZ
MSSTAWMPLVAFAAVVALIPVALWVMRRAGVGGASQGNLLRTVSSLSLSPSQRVVVVELMQGAASRWLVLGVTSEQITTLTTLDAPLEVPSAIRDPQAPTVTQLMDRWRQGKPGSRRND